MVRYLLPVFLAISFVASAIAQDLQVEATKAKAFLTKQTLTKTQLLDESGGVITESVSRGPEMPAGEEMRDLITVKSTASMMTIEASDKNRNPVLVTELGDKQYLLAPFKGDVWVRVDVIDFDLKIFANKTIIVNSDSNVDPVDPDPVDPDPPPVVDNEYGMGKVAVKFAPDDNESKLAYAKMYRQAGDFLYGRPTLKSVYTANNPSADNNVFYWLRDQGNAMQCRDAETCEQWKEWRNQIAKAFDKSQTTRQFTSITWYKAFEEVAKALEGSVK